MNPKSICAVVVTYNRKELLLRCLKALQMQSQQLAHILVVNNASSDGTIDFLSENGFSDNSSFTLLNLEENLGGAGGFHYGIKWVYEKGFDYIWLMDDDGLPEQHCLAELTKYITKDNYIGPLVLNINNPKELTFSLRLPNTNTVIYTQDEANLYGVIIKDIVMPFNGILFSRKVVDSIGLPYKEYFIWGDDMEYTWRAKKNKIAIFTVNSAKFYHPKEASLGTPMFFRKLRFNDTESALKLYCMCRNNLRNLIEYKGYLIALLFIIKVCWFYLFTKPNFNKLRISLNGIWAGLVKDFTKHKKYLGI